MGNELEVRNLQVSFKTNNGTVKAVRDISFDLKKGETIAIVGESGSGKSVTAKAIMGILAGNSIVEGGEILYHGENLLAYSDKDMDKIRGNKITMIFQDPMSSLDPIMKIGKQMTEASLINGKQNQKAAAREYRQQLRQLKWQLGHADCAKQALPLLEQYEKIMRADSVRYKEWYDANNNSGKDIEKPVLYQMEEREQLERYLSDVMECSQEQAAEKLDHLAELAFKRIHKITKQTAHDNAIRIMRDVGIQDPEKRFNQYPFEFSGGMRQRIVIAIAIAANPDILICDEPTTALDVTIQAQIMELINEIKRKRQLSVVFITHDLGVVANMADKVAVMYAGKIVEQGTVDDIFYRPAHPYTWALLSSMPDLDTKGKLEAIPGTPPNMIYPPVGDAFAERNKYAMAIDFKRQPPMFRISDTHSAATWLLHPDAPKVEPPAAVTERIERMKKLREQED